MDRESASRHELVVDNRKLVLAFIVLMVLLGISFGIGYREGKHQGYEDGQQIALESTLKTNSALMPSNSAAPATADAAAPGGKDDVADSNLTWFDNVKRPDGEPEAVTPLEEAVTAPVAKENSLPPKDESREPAPVTARQTVKKNIKEAAEKVIPQARAASAEKVTYTVQAGAFKARREAETKAKALRAEGYDPRIDIPNSPEGLYLLKVGKFASRADATALQLKLQKSGFASFIKIN